MNVTRPVFKGAFRKLARLAESKGSRASKLESVREWKTRFRRGEDWRDVLEKGAGRFPVGMDQGKSNKEPVV